jgi:methylated-DNA-[protein]-cysteine S-methyltransferase
MHLRLDQYSSPVSPLLLVTDDQGALRALEFGDQPSRLERMLRVYYESYTLEPGTAPASVIAALDAYFDGDLGALDDVRVATGGTEFQRSVWQALRTISAGTTQSYGQLAASLGRPAASRAVGAANGSNPVSIVVPCHRVIGASGSLTGYGGGLPRKRWLLDHEQKYVALGLADSRRHRPSVLQSGTR